MRFFNTAGPCEPDRHYMIPAADRLPEARGLVDQGGYFVVHAPRQSGKTTTLRALAQALTAEGRYAALYLSCKPAETAGSEVAAAQRALLGILRSRAQQTLPPELLPPEPWPEAPALLILFEALRVWAAQCPRPLVLFFDEIDTLYGDALRSVLAQLHTAYPERPKAAPWSVVLCGLRDIKDYRETLGPDPRRFQSASPFNIKLETLRLGNFNEAAVRALYAQHSADTGQPFMEEAIEQVMLLSGGQPWLVNALAREIVEKMRIPPPQPISPLHVEQAKERLILSRATHLDSLLARLNEPRVRSVLEPVIAGSVISGDNLQQDVEYVRDLGLLALDRPLRIANPIYHEVIVRVLADAVEGGPEGRRFLDKDGRLDLLEILRGFAEFWKENGEVLTGCLLYHEVAPQLVLMSYLQGIINGRGHIIREYGLGRGRIDLLLRWPYQRADGTAWQKEAIELKVWADKKADPLVKGLDQLEKYLDRCGLTTGALIIFDRRSSGLPIEERVQLSEAQTPKGYQVHLLRA